MDQNDVNKLDKAYSSLSESTRLEIARLLNSGRFNPAQLVREIYNIKFPEVYTNNEYLKLWGHLKKMEKEGLVKRIPKLPGTKRQDYEITELGRMALMKKPRRNQ